MLTDKEPAGQDIETGHNQDPTHPRPKRANKAAKTSNGNGAGTKSKTASSPVTESPFETGHNEDPPHPRPRSRPTRSRKTG
ncbi:MAG: hypothetical protein IPK82_28565 [Polyangiaceae bacterium]|nr:hypothetical protein [Polyangiaceae bacterium]